MIKDRQVFQSVLIEDELTTDALRQVFDNVRALRKEIIALKSRVLSLETEKDTDLL